MKHLLSTAFMILSIGCRRTPKEEQNPENHPLLDLIASRAHSVIIVDEDWPVIITNKTGQVMVGNPMRTVGTLSSPDTVNALAVALSETGKHGPTNICFCGTIPWQVFLDDQGEPLASALVHIEHNHVIVSTNIALFDEQLFFIHPSGVPSDTAPSLPKGYNPYYSQLALEVAKTIWPEECVRRNLKGAEDLIQAHKEAEERQREAKRTEQLLRISGSL